jgi:hypothetical protein
MKKPQSKVTAEKIAVIAGYIAQQNKAVQEIEARIRAMSADTPKEHVEHHKKLLATALYRVAELKAQKRKPGDLLMLTELTGIRDRLKNPQFRRKNPELVYAAEAQIRLEADRARYRHEQQRIRATTPRGRGFDKRTMRELVRDTAKAHRYLSPAELLPHVHSAAVENDMRLISIKRLRDLLRELKIVR